MSYVPKYPLTLSETMSRLITEVEQKRLNRRDDGWSFITGWGSIDNKPSLNIGYLKYGISYRVSIKTNKIKDVMCLCWDTTLFTPGSNKPISTQSATIIVDGKLTLDKLHNMITRVNANICKYAKENLECLYDAESLYMDGALQDIGSVIGIVEAFEIELIKVLF